MMAARFEFDCEDLEDEYDEPGRCTQALSIEQARLIQDKKSAAEIRLARSRSRDPSRHGLQMLLSGFGTDATKQVEAGDSIGDSEIEAAELTAGLARKSFQFRVAAADTLQVMLYVVWPVTRYFFCAEISIKIFFHQEYEVDIGDRLAEVQNNLVNEEGQASKKRRKTFNEKIGSSLTNKSTRAIDKKHLHQDP